MPIFLEHDVPRVRQIHPTGVTRYTTELLRELLPLLSEHEVVLFFSGRTALGQFPWDLPAHVRVVHRTMPNRLRNALWVFGLGTPMDVLCGDVDVLFMPCPLFVRVSAKTRLVLSFHDASFERMPEVFSMYQRLWHKAVGHKLLAQKAHAILAVSQATKHDVVDLYGVPEEKVHVVYSAIAHAPVHVPVKLPDIVRQPYVVMVGTKEKRKNILAVLAGWEEAKRLGSALQLVIVGRDGFGARAVRRALKKSAYAVDCIDIAYASDAEVRGLVACAKIAVYPSWYEGFGLPILEAMAAGVPVITSAETAMAEIAQDAALLVHPSHPEEITVALRALENSRIFERVKKKGLIRVAEFSWYKAAQETKAALV